MLFRKWSYLKGSGREIQSKLNALKGFYCSIYNAGRRVLNVFLF